MKIFNTAQTEEEQLILEVQMQTIISAKVLTEALIRDPILKAKFVMNFK